MVAVALIVFPKLPRLSGFETGVAVMPLVAGIPPTPSTRRGGSTTPANC